MTMKINPEIDAKTFNEIFKLGWVSAGKKPDTGEYQIAALQARSIYLRYQEAYKK